MTNKEFAALIAERNSAEAYEAEVRKANSELNLSDEQIVELVEFNSKYYHIFVTALKLAKNAKEAYDAYDKAKRLGLGKLREMLSSENYEKIVKKMNDEHTDDVIKLMFDGLEYVSEKDNNVEVNSIEEVLKIKAAARKEIEQTAIEAGLN